MFGMSVNEVPGWLVAMAPSAIGVPVALTPGLLPHCEVSTVAVLAPVLEAPAAGVVPPVLVLVLLPEMLLQPARAAPVRARAAASTPCSCCLVLFGWLLFLVARSCSPPRGGGGWVGVSSR